MLPTRDRALEVDRSVEALDQALLSALRGGTPPRDLLARVGDPDPAAAAAAFERTARDPDLASALEHWAPALLRSARPGFGADALLELARLRRRDGPGPLEIAALPALPRLLGASNCLTRVLLRRPAWTEELRGALPAAPHAASPPADWDEIRRAKYRGLLRVAARDLLGRPLRESLRELSDLADGCLGSALACAAAEDGVHGAALLALGKLGGRELNFSSDVDLLFLYTGEPDRGLPDRAAAVSRLVRRLKAETERATAEGFLYRVDLGLRPEGASGALALSVDAALSYYESFGVEWERQMLIRLRPLAGTPAAGERFAREITPFVYRRAIDPGVMAAVRRMKEKIESERSQAGRDLEGSLKEGPGGIRDVEFLVQALQLFHGGPQPELRTGNVLDALDALERLRLLPGTVSRALADAYTWLRRAEHALQLVEERQTCAFPRDPEGQLGLARRLGYAEPEAARARDRLLDDWTAARSAVRTHFEALVLREPE